MSIDAREPPGGDFVAYIDRLLRAQAARHAQPAAPVAPPAVAARKLSPAQAEAAAQALLLKAGTDKPRAPSLASGTAEHAATLTAEQAQQLLARLNAGGQAGPSLVAIIVGIGLVVGGGAMNAGPLPFFLGIAAIVWGARRLERLKKSKS